MNSAPFVVVASNDAADTAFDIREMPLVKEHGYGRNWWSNFCWLDNKDTALFEAVLAAETVAEIHRTGFLRNWGCGIDRDSGGSGYWFLEGSLTIAQYTELWRFLDPRGYRLWRA